MFHHRSKLGSRRAVPTRIFQTKKPCRTTHSDLADSPARPGRAHPRRSLASSRPRRSLASSSPPLSLVRPIVETLHANHLGSIPGDPTPAVSLHRERPLRGHAHGGRFSLQEIILRFSHSGARAKILACPAVQSPHALWNSSSGRASDSRSESSGFKSRFQNPRAPLTRTRRLFHHVPQNKPYTQRDMQVLRGRALRAPTRRVAGLRPVAAPYPRGSNPAHQTIW